MQKQGSQPAKQPLVAPWAMKIFFVGFGLLVGVSAFNTIRREMRAASTTPSVGNGGAQATGVSVTAREREPGPPRVVATLPPLLWVAKSLAPANADVTLLVPPGQGCHGIELTPSQIASTRRADVVLMVGAGLEPQIEQTTTPAGQRRVVLTSALPEGEALLHAECDHEHETEGDVSHDHDHTHAMDPHAWLDPAVMRRYIEVSAASMSAAWPDESEAIAARAVAAIAQVDAVDAAYRERLGGLASRTIVTHHNAWGYLARRYGLEVAAVIQPIHDIEPSPGDVANAADMVRERGVRAVFVEPQFSQAAAQRIASITGARVVTLDSLGEGDWPALMRRNLDALAQGLNAGQ